MVTGLLQQDPAKRLTTQQLLTHEWFKKMNVATETPLDNVVLTRMRQFAQMNKLKKMCLMVVGQNMSPEDIAGRAWELMNL